MEIEAICFNIHFLAIFLEYQKNCAIFAENIKLITL